MLIYDEGVRIANFSVLS